MRDGHGGIVVEKGRIVRRLGEMRRREKSLKRGLGSLEQNGVTGFYMGMRERKKLK